LSLWAVLALLWCFTGAWAQSSNATTARSRGIDPALLAKAQAGNAAAEFQVGLNYEGGIGVPQDYAQAAFWFKKADSQGNANAAYRVGILYMEGWGVPQDWTQAASWYRQAAERGNAEAQFQLSLQLEAGQGVPQDTVEALEWSRKAAEQGYSDAENQLGILYEEGGPMKRVQEPGGGSKLVPASGDASIPKDYALAAIWYRKAADQGHASAQSSLASLYENGQGVPQDYSEAYFWMSLAAANGSSVSYSESFSERCAADRDRIATQLTRTDLARVQERTTKWFAAHQPKAQ
jgi:hypothetical protein